MTFASALILLATRSVSGWGDQLLQSGSRCGGLEVTVRGGVNVVHLHEFRMTGERLFDIQVGSADLLDGLHYLGLNQMN